MSTFDPRMRRTTTVLGTRTKTMLRPPARPPRRMPRTTTQPANRPEAGSCLRLGLSGGSSWKLAFPPNCLPYFSQSLLTRTNTVPKPVCLSRNPCSKIIFFK
uniref:(northern house mosquito) hypothetical protein n=1 Tax=Culex pipiens TaxID=7175 RepID=A0A8D8B944_CULPI